METTLNSLTGPIVLARTRAPDLESVRKLNCWGSEIDDISIVREMPNLEICSVSVNDITTLKDFEACENLQELYIRNNKIQELTDICYLKGLEKLRILWLSDNPCAVGDNYRMTVIRNLPQLQKLDNVVVEDDEKTAAKEQGEELSLPDPDQGSEPSEEKPVINGEAIAGGDSESNDVKKLPKDPVTLSWEETNKIREQLGLKPLPIEKIGSPKSAPTHSTRTRNAHVLQAVLILVKELDRDSLEIVETAIRKRLDTL
ncbi:cilia- and flagella-associated protein 410-like [Ruditapes philippinarum]|uniref:cilia- and flagella-associated protein 410-like n=1 Tax=Ruditapes philippinarum TaxID=129788 RepID=UPI00295AEA31|nr:cilia- and flagella-associated protein 410-like [Ruditapes philippinarum]